MPKFSIIVPVYNVEKYIKKCLDSIMNQSFKDYEVIVINDGTKDKSMDIVKKYDVKIINQENKGQSSARNHGIKEAKGEYIVFLDSDDTIERDLLKELNEVTKDKPDVVRFQVRETYENKENIEYKEEAFDTCEGEEAFSKICKYHFVEAVALYCVKREYYEKEKFTFAEGMLHEDFRLIPLLIIKAKKVKSISYIGYNYLQRENSTMNTTDYKKTKKKVEDFYNHYQYMIKEINKTKLDSKVFKSFISNSLILKVCELKGKDYKKYKKKLIEDKVFDNLLTDTFTRKIKKVLFRISPKMGKKLI